VTMSEPFHKVHNQPEGNNKQSKKYFIKEATSF